MVGRGVLKDPWIFGDQPSKIKDQGDRLGLVLEHTRLFVKTWGKSKNFEELKKYFKIYIRDFSQAQAWREKLMGCRSLEEVESVARELRGSVE